MKAVMVLIRLLFIILFALSVELVPAVSSAQIACGDVFKASVQDRAMSLISAWPDNVALLENVKIRDSKKTRNLLLISTDGLSKEKANELKEAYIDIMENDTISFPASADLNHLFIRDGKDVYDFDADSSVLVKRNYRFGRQRLEPVVRLTRDEVNSLEQYLRNSKNRTETTLGSFNIKGSVENNGALNDNRPFEGGHNCASWICTAPIGSNGQTLGSLVQGKAQVDRFKKWMNHLLAEAPPERVPFVVIQTDGTDVRDLAGRITQNRRGFSWQSDIW